MRGSLVLSAASLRQLGREDAAEGTEVVERVAENLREEYGERAASYYLEGARS